MVAHYFQRLERTFKFLLLCLRKKVIIGKHSYAVLGLFRNKFAVATIDADSYEEWAGKIFELIFRLRDGAFIDVGANVGQTMIRIIALDENRQYIGFEPQASGCSFIQDFIMRNGLERHAIIQAALSDRPGIVKLGLRQQYDQAASAIEEYRPKGFYSFYQYVPALKGDEVLSHFALDSISLLKIDVEGGELEVLLGFQHTIEKYQPYIIFEVLPQYLLSTGEQLSKDIITKRNNRNAMLEKFLREKGYVIFQLPTEGGLMVAEVIEASKAGEKNIVTNYAAVPKDEADRFEALYSDLFKA